MAKKSTGHAKTKLVRVEPLDLTDIQFLRKKVMFKKFDGDVVHQLIGMFKQHKIKSPLKEQGEGEDEYKSLYEDLVETNKTNFQIAKLLCEKLEVKYADMVQHVKCQV